MDKVNTTNGVTISKRLLPKWLEFPSWRKKNPHLISIVNTVMTFLMFPIVRKILCSNWLDDVKGKLVSGLVLVSILLICESNDLSRQTNCVFSTRGGDGTRERKVEKTVDLTIICHARFSLSLSTLACFVESHSWSMRLMKMVKVTVYLDFLLDAQVAQNL